MKKLCIVPISLVLFFACLPCLAFAQEDDPKQAIWQDVSSSINAIYAPGFNFSETAEQVANGKINVRLDNIVNLIISMLGDEVKGNANLIIKVLALAVLAGALCNLQPNAADGVANICFLACLAAIAGLSVTLIAGLAETAASAMDTMLLFIASIMPVMSSLSVTLGATAGFHAGLFLAMQIFVTLCRNVFLPLIMVITALSVANALSGRFGLSRLLEAMRQCIKWGLGLLLTVFVGLLGIQSFSTGAATGIAGKTVKYALGNFVPLVGSVLADSAEAVYGSMRIIRGAIGITGILALLSLCCLPLFKVLANAFLYRLAAGIAEPATDKRIVDLLVDLSGNITLIFSILLMTVVMFIISLALLCLLTF